MDYKRLRQYIVRFFFAAIAFTLGLASSVLWHRAPASPPPARYVAPAPSLPVIGVCAPAKEMKAEEEDTRVEDRYYNYDFGFSVDIPKGVVGERPPAPMPNHGFVIDLENPQAVKMVSSWSSINVDAYYNSALWESLDAVVKGEVDDLPNGEGNILSLKITHTRLSGLRSMHIVETYDTNREPMVNDVTLALRREHGEEVIYRLYLNTPLSRYERDKDVVAFLQKTWCLQPLP